MIYPGPLINRPPCQLRLTSPPPPQTLPHIPTIPIHPHWFPQLVHMQHTGSWHESCMTCCSFFMSGCSRQGKPNAKLGSVRPVFPPPDRMKFFWAVKSSIPLRQPKKRNSQAWLLKKYLCSLRYQTFKICCATWHNPERNRVKTQVISSSNIHP